VLQCCVAPGCRRAPVQGNDRWKECKLRRLHWVKENVRCELRQGTPPDAEEVPMAPANPALPNWSGGRPAGGEVGPHSRAAPALRSVKCRPRQGAFP